MFLSKSCFIIVFPVIILFTSCFSTPSTPRRVDVDIMAIESAIIDELNNMDIIIWEKGKSFTELDVSNAYTFLSIHGTTITPDKSWDGIFSTTISFVDKNNLQKDIVIIRKVDVIEGGVSYGRGVQVGPVIFDDDIIISLADVNNLPWIYYGRDRSNMYGHESIDTRYPANITFIVKNNETLKKYYEKVAGQNRSNLNNNRQQDNVNKLIALLVNPMAAGQFGQFVKGEVVNVPRALLSVIDLQEMGNLYLYLVSVNDYNVSKPFYIVSDKMFNLMDLNYPNTIFQDLKIEYLGTEMYYNNKVPRETFLFQLTQNK